MYLTSVSISYPQKKEPSFTVIEILNGKVEHFDHIESLNEPLLPAIIFLRVDKAFSKRKQKIMSSRHDVARRDQAYSIRIQDVGCQEFFKTKTRL